MATIIPQLLPRCQALTLTRHLLAKEVKQAHTVSTISDVTLTTFAERHALAAIHERAHHTLRAVIPFTALIGALDFYGALVPTHFRCFGFHDVRFGRPHLTARSCRSSFEPYPLPGHTLHRDGSHGSNTRDVRMVRHLSRRSPRRSPPCRRYAPSRQRRRRVYRGGALSLCRYGVGS